MIMIWEGQPLATTAQRLSSADILSVEFRTVANRPAEGAYLSTLHDNAGQMEKSAAQSLRRSLPISVSASPRYKAYLAFHPDCRDQAILTAMPHAEIRGTTNGAHK